MRRSSRPPDRAPRTDVRDDEVGQGERVDDRELRDTGPLLREGDFRFARVEDEHRDSLRRGWYRPGSAGEENIAEDPPPADRELGRASSALARAVGQARAVWREIHVEKIGGTAQRSGRA